MVGPLTVKGVWLRDVNRSALSACLEPKGVGFRGQFMGSKNIEGLGPDR